MSDKEMLSKEQRAELCPGGECKEHGNGTTRCPIPLYKEDLQSVLQNRETSSDVSIGDAEPKTATGKVVRSDE